MDSPNHPPQLVPSVEAAVRCGLSPDHVGALCRRGLVVGVRSGRTWLVSEESLRAYMARAEQLKDERRRALSEQIKKLQTPQPGTSMEFAPALIGAALVGIVALGALQVQGSGVLLPARVLTAAVAGLNASAYPPVLGAAPATSTVAQHVVYVSAPIAAPQPVVQKVVVAQPATAPLPPVPHTLVATTTYVTQASLAAQLSAALQQLRNSLASAGTQVPAQVAGGGYGAVYGAVSAPPPSASSIATQLIGMGYNLSGGSGNGSSASTTLLADSNTFSGSNVFGPAESTLSTFLRGYTLPKTLVTNTTEYSGLGVESSGAGGLAIFGVQRSTTGDSYGIEGDAYVGQAGHSAYGLFGYAGTDGVNASELTGLQVNVGSGAGNAYGVRVGDMGGAASNAYGLSVGDVTGGVSGNYAIKTGLGKISFGDKVGIGTTTPNQTLVVDSSNGSTVNINAGSSYNPQLLFSQSATSTQWQFLFSANGAGSWQVCQQGVACDFSILPGSGNLDVGGSNAAGSKLSVEGNAAIGTDFYNHAAPTNGLIVEGNIGVGTTSPYAPLSVVGQVVASNFTATSSTALSYFAGNVGIGTNSQFSALDVAGPEISLEANYDPYGRFQVYDSNDGGNLGYAIRTATGGGWRWQFTDGGGAEYFGVDYPTGNVATKGAVGVKKTTADYALDVAGDINFTGSLYADGAPLTSNSPKLLGASDTGKSKNYSSLVGALNQLAFSPDGTKLFISEFSSVYGATLSVPWDISTAGYPGDFLDLTSEITNSYGVAFSKDGSTLFVCNGHTIFQYTLATPWSVAYGTQTYTGKSLSLNAHVSNPTGNITFSGDGLHVYVEEPNTESVYEYTMGTAWDISTASYTGSKDVSDTLAGGTYAAQVQFSGDGKVMYVGASDGGTHDLTLYEFLLATAWDVTTATYDGVSVDTGVTGSAATFAMSADRTHLYIPTGNPTFLIHDFAMGSGTNFWSGFTAWGLVGVGTPTPAYALDVATSTTDAVVARFTNGTGNCTINPTNTALSCSSDQRLKKDFNNLLGSTSLSQVLALDPLTYNWLSEATGTQQHAGFIAQAVQTIFPDLVSTDSNGYLALNYAGFVPYIVSALQQLAHTVAGFAEQFTTKKLCLSDDTGTTCVTKAQLDALLLTAGQGQPAPAPQSTPDQSSTTDQTASSTSE